MAEDPVSYDRNLLTHRINTELIPIFEDASGTNAEVLHYDYVLTQNAADERKLDVNFYVVYQGTKCSIIEIFDTHHNSGGGRQEPFTRKKHGKSQMARSIRNKLQTNYIF